MPQHDLILDNGSGAAFRADANSALAALGSTMKGPNAPPAPIAGMMWLDDDTPSASVWTLKIYDGADWLSIATFDISANTWAPSISLLRLAAGTAAAPAYSFTGDPDTGIYQSASNVLDISAGGNRLFQVNNSVGNSFVVLDNVPGQTFTVLYFRALDASASSARTGTFQTLNENSIPVTSIDMTVHTDGSGTVSINPTPSGARNTDRRVNRMIIPGAGAISMVGPVNVTSGGQTVTGDLEASGNLRFNSGYGSAAIAYGVRAWVNFNGTGTVAIRASGGVTSITDNGTGDYTVNFNFTMPDTNYAAVGNASPNTATISAGILIAVTRSTTGVRVLTSDNNTDQLFDYQNVDLIVVR